MFAGRGVRLIIQSAYFVLIARALGAENYGAFVAVASLVGILSPFATLGAGNLLIKNVARDPSVVREYWGNALLLTGVAGALLTAVVMTVAALLLPGSVSLLLVVVVSVADMVFLGIICLATQAFQAVERLDCTARLWVHLSLARLLGAAVLAFAVDSPGPLAWGVIYLLTTAASATVAVRAVNRTHGRPRLALWRIHPELREGCYFSISLSAQTVYNDIDKAMLASLASLHAAGVYAAACRIVDAAFAPIAALLAAAYPRFFRHGLTGVAGSTKYAFRLLSYILAPTAVMSLVLMTTAPLLPRILGDDFRLSVSAVRYLSVLPLIKAIQYLSADALTGAGFQGTRTLLQMVVGSICVGLNLFLIPLLSWRGAIVSSLVTNIILAAALSIAILVLTRRLIEPELEPSIS
jgi:O-antigen/teichoic acid export membrane protein